MPAFFQKWLNTTPSSISPTTPFLTMQWDTLFNSGVLYIQPGDPSVVKRGNQWYMYFAALGLADARISVFEATLPPYARLSPTGWNINLTPIFGPQPSGNWNYSATETPCYVRGYVSGVEVERIYYAGWTYAAQNPDGKANYNLSYAQLSSSGWINYNVRILPTGTIDTSPTLGSLCGDQAVIYHSGVWHLYYQGITGVSPYVTTTFYMNSDNGRDWINKQEVNFSPPNALSNLPKGPYHIGAHKINDRILLTGWLTSGILPTQGIWCTTSPNPLKIDQTDYSTWVPLVYEASGVGTYWWNNMNNATLWPIHTIGYFGSCLAQDNDRTYLFYSSVVDSGTRYANIGCVQVNLFNGKKRRTHIPYGRPQQI